MKKFIAIGFILLAPWSLANNARETVYQIESASHRGDTQSLKSIETHGDQFADAFRLYQLASHATAKQAYRESLNYLERAVPILEKQIEKEAQNADAHALLAAIYGWISGQKPESATVYGPLSHQLIATAREINGEDPQVNLLSGIIKFHTPEAYGGSKQEALKLFGKAITAYESAGDAGWGKADAYVWRAVILRDLGKTVRAQEDLTTALNIDPEYGWAKFLRQSF